ncbi:hypothetical protein [Streptomyces sp. NPDC002580]|uniref:hypothetical protein n=1 Tax=Streptomyces sp. NPDC002580 TaxID=3364653 RepID=UPI00369947B6
MHHRTFPAVLALAALAFVSGCSGDDTGSPSGTGGRQTPSAPAGPGLPGPSAAAADPGTPGAPDEAAGQDEGDSGYAAPVDRCVTALLAYTSGGLPDACTGLSPEELNEAIENAGDSMERDQQARRAAIDLIG